MTTVYLYRSSGQATPPGVAESLAISFNMADEEVATKAPESDAKEPSMVSAEDTPAQKGASMGVRCAPLYS